jgi:DNA processing protein
LTNQPIDQKRYFHLDDGQRLNWLRLIRSQNVGPATFRDLISHYGTAAAALEALPELAERGGAASRIKICPIEDAEREMIRCESAGARLIAIGEPDYPPVLRNADQSPPLIAVIGNSETLLKKTVAIVGSRNASIAGMKLAQRFSSQLGEYGYVITSGLARGIDTAAHRASLATGTITVFAGGVDQVFPEENRDLAKAIVDNDGVLLSEMPMGWQPRAKDFPRRNRIVTGLAQGVVVVEAAKRSGSLISARLANEMGRLVLAVPGSPLDPRSEGTNGLIKQGATLVTSTEDILEALTPLDSSANEFIYDDITEGSDELPFEVQNGDVQTADDTIRNAIISSLGTSPAEIDDIIRFTGAKPGQVQLVLMELALAGRLERHTGNRVSLIE